MRKVFLDTSFIITCIKEKLDFSEEIQNFGFEIVIPKEVIYELKGLSKSNIYAKTSLKLIEKSNFKKIELKNKNVDKGLVSLSKKNSENIIATMDKELKKKIKNQKMIVRGKKKLELI